MVNEYVVSNKFKLSFIGKNKLKVSIHILPEVKRCLSIYFNEDFETFHLWLVVYEKIQLETTGKRKEIQLNGQHEGTIDVPYPVYAYFEVGVQVRHQFLQIIRSNWLYIDCTNKHIKETKLPRVDKTPSELKWKKHVSTYSYYERRMIHEKER